MKYLRFLRIFAAALFFCGFVAACFGWEPTMKLLHLQLGPSLVRLISSFSFGILTCVLTFFLLTLIFGRIYCSVFCPLGILQDVLNVRLKKKFRYSRALKFLRYPVLILVCVLAFSGTLFPATWLLPSSNFVMMLNHLWRPETAAFAAAWGLFILLLILVRWKGRVYCNSLCPVGAILSIFSRVSLFRVRVRSNCVHCGLCEKVCKAGCIDSKTGMIDAADCVGCMDCLGACKTNALTLLPISRKKKLQAKQPARMRRRVLITLGSLVTFPIAKRLEKKIAAGRKPDELKADVERKVLPPGAWSYEKFRTRCVGCGLCAGVCKGHAIELSMGEHGVLGTLQPFLNYDHGKCLVDCCECMNICPTGAIQNIDLKAKQSLRLGIGGYDPLRCRAFTGEDPCGECEKACPVKAISLIEFKGKMIPKFDDDLCIGCGACQFACPVEPKVMRVIPAVEQTFSSSSFLDDLFSLDVRLVNPMIKHSLFFVFCLLSFSFSLSASEFRPASIWTPCECASEETSIEKMADGNLATYADLLDDTRTGTKDSTVPPKGSAPVTCSFVLDLGETREVCGLRFVSANNWILALPENVSVYSCGDAHGETDLRPIVENYALPSLFSGLSSFVKWEKTPARFLKVQVNDSYGKDYKFWWSGGIWKGILAKTPYPFYGDGSRWETRIAEVRAFDAIPEDCTGNNPPDVAFPKWRMERDWLYQDHGLDVSDVFVSRENADAERAMVEKALRELGATSDSARFQETLRTLISEKVPGADPRWKALYFEVCAARRLVRLAWLRERSTQFIYTKHFLGGNEHSEDEVDFDVTDEQFWDLKPIHSNGAQLCRITINEDLSLTHEVLLEQPEGMICDASVSDDGKTVVFAMRKNFTDDNLYIYTMELPNTGTTLPASSKSSEGNDSGNDVSSVVPSIRQITFPLKANGTVYPNGHRYPVFTPEGKIIFAATRCVQINDCWPRQNWDLYSCDPDGSHIVRLTFDQLKTDSPKVMPDGKIVFCRWEYNDRNAYYPHLLMTMNPDGTSQMEYYGGGSVYPCNMIQPCGVPGTSKVLAVISGHHTHNRGKLALIDRTKGTQHGVGIEYVAGASPLEFPPQFSAPMKPCAGRQESYVWKPGSLFTHWEWDFFGQSGPQYHSPYAFDETHYLCSFHPEGWLRLKGPYSVPFGAYFMTADGERELLAFDWKNPCLNLTPVTPAFRAPAIAKNCDYTQNFGTYYIQNVYIGPGLKGIPQGTVKRLRVCAMAYRHAKMGQGNNAGEAGQGPSQTAISLLNGSWDVKHVLGEVDVEEDGSACFFVPVRQPVFFQLLDERGYIVQTMRSWSTLQGGERLACLGCHENKNDALTTDQRKATIAMRKPIQMPRGPFGKEHPLMVRLQTQNGLDSVENYLGVNASYSLDPNARADGFNYMDDVQPIWDRHCVTCHRGNVNDPDPLRRSKLSLTSELLDPKGKVRQTYGYDYKKLFAQSYCALTCWGEDVGNPYLNWLNARARSEMIPPYFYGSSKSPLMKFLEPSHYGVQVSDEEKHAVACWIDLNVPYCGTHSQSNTWTPEEKKEFQYFLDKRDAFARQEIEYLKE
ncbi:MAG: 4Fe-4S dicluster domain-containing protein [Thermoguttaceae bacterium]|nr:4Fe-4S dicluster domain-containing protein [Thermoguttaceae bacterium]